MTSSSAFRPPLLSSSTAHLLAFSFGLAYVGSLYISKHARVSFTRVSVTRPKQREDKARDRYEDERWRNDPGVIRARLFAASVATVLCCGAVWGIGWKVEGIQVCDWELGLRVTLQRLGMSSFGGWKAYLVTPTLFLGPLWAMWLSQSLPGQRFWMLTGPGGLVQQYATWQGFRNYIVGPITEELVFRACVLAAYGLAGASRSMMIFCSPLVFGLAHIHHAWETYNRYGRTAVAAKRAILGSVFQFAYTSVFGFHCAYLFIRTGSVFPAIMSHIFCNVMGVPQLSWEVRKHPSWKESIYVVYVVGIVGYVSLLGPWTETAGSVYGSIATQ
ncbi:Abi-domain-containing protein [Pluteus cervinus]|uniref:Abi-domain-containing protein n=1 Tax=Pluteus cervinus TaxID=181527 RepID=A0ACD3ASG5_9AGAR|nr:Abi-domain-containing protein [Pluteus cervinus]